MVQSFRISNVEPPMDEPCRRCGAKCGQEAGVCDHKYKCRVGLKEPNCCKFFNTNYFFIIPVTKIVHDFYKFRSLNLVSICSYLR